MVNCRMPVIELVSGTRTPAAPLAPAPNSSALPWRPGTRALAGSSDSSVPWLSLPELSRAAVPGPSSKRQ